MPMKSTAKRQRGVSSKTKDVKSSLNVFVSVAVEEQYNNYNKNRACIRERGFSLSNNPAFAHIQETIQTRGWATYCPPPPLPKNGSMMLVREFYANAKEHRNHKTKVRGIVVRFDEETINWHLGLVALEEDDLANYTKRADMQQVMDTIRLYPTTHVFECSRERALALFAIALGMRMNVRAIINAAILHAANINNTHPALNPNDMVRIWNNQLEDGEDEAGPSRASAERKSKASISDLYEMYQSHDDRLDDIQAQLGYDRQWNLEHAEYQAFYFNTIEKMFQHFGFSSGHDMIGFPQMPPFPDHLRHPYQRAS
ncbi:hypothetical protein TIFTF001_017565 [Ficus carica]|uniref:Putative plant transposon protein domain-containing protein n=1 Tax=Ficus carica TaxID=3494 RepID=A0AA88A9G1_FICCA|nr:hypothetical protein TIFTF001_017565 [Ficus carica]